jgi:hypothetical protein
MPGAQSGQLPKPQEISLGSMGSQLFVRSVRCCFSQPSEKRGRRKAECGKKALLKAWHLSGKLSMPKMVGAVFVRGGRFWLYRILQPSKRDEEQMRVSVCCHLVCRTDCFHRVVAERRAAQEEGEGARL